MNIKWYGHSCFLLTDNNGTRILTDPCDPSYGYDLPEIQADAVTVSHDHNDHNYVRIAKGEPQIIRSVGTFRVNDIGITGIATYHDKMNGALRGGNIMYIYEMDDMRILHCGDIGGIPDESVISSLGRIDVLLVPIGAIYTIDDLEARELANIIKPSVVIPMHYKTPSLKIELCPLAPFIDAAKDCKIHRINDYEATINRVNLGEDRVIVLRPYDADRDEP